MAQQSSQYPSATDNTDSLEISNSPDMPTGDNIVNIDTGLEDEREKILKWLSPVEPYQQHQTARAERPDGVGDWLLETHGFLKWSGSSTQGGCVHTVLGCSAQWGAGKTHLSSLVIDALCSQTARKDMAVAWVYCKSSALEEHSTINMLGAILKQLVSGIDIPANIRQAFQNDIAEQGPQYEDIVEMLKTTIASLPQVYICLDSLEFVGMDYGMNYYGTDYQEEAFSLLRDFFRESPRTRLFFTGRLWGREQVEQFFPDVIIFPISHTGDDIRTHDQIQLPCDEKEPEKAAKKLLKRHRIQPNLADEYDRTPLLFAAKYGHQEVVKMLLGRDDIEPNTLDTKECLTPLLWAARKGNGEVISILIERGKIDPNARLGLTSNTVLGLAAEYGHEGVVKMLLERRDIKPDLASRYNLRTPLVWAAISGHEKIVKTLLEMNEVNPNTLDREGSTALVWSVRCGHEKVVKVLLERGDVDPNTLDTSYRGETPLGWAAGDGLVEVVKMLLKRRDIQPDIPNKRGCTPLLLAARHGSEKIVTMLLQRKDVNPDKANNGGKPPLSWAARRGYEEVVKMLLQTGRVNPNRRDSTDVKKGQTPLSYAAQWGRMGVVKMLLEHNAIDPDMADKHGRTPLSYAAERGQMGIVKTLLEHNAVDSEIADEDGRMPLSYAAEEGQAGVVKILLEHTGVDPEKADNHGRTPLFYANNQGYPEIVNLFSTPRAPIPGPADGQQLT